FRPRRLRGNISDDLGKGGRTGLRAGERRTRVPRHPDRRRRIRGAVAAAPRDERTGPRPLRAAMPASAPTTFPALGGTHAPRRTHSASGNAVAVEQRADLLQRLALQNRVPADLVGAGNGVTLRDLGVFRV